jgi:hypothetical protein
MWYKDDGGRPTMGNHDVYDTPEDKKARAAERELQEVIRSLREYLMKMNASLFSVDELYRLINPLFNYDTGSAGLEYKKWLLGVKGRVDGGRPGGWSSATKKTP